MRRSEWHHPGLNECGHAIDCSLALRTSERGSVRHDPAGVFLITDFMPERLVTPLIVIVLLLGTLFALRSTHSSSVTSAPVAPVAALVPDMVPLVTGNEPITEIFTRAGCAVCHTVPGIPGAAGRIGPLLTLGA